MSQVSKDQSSGHRSATDEVQLSVIIPCRDAAETLGHQLTALAEQSAPVGWEVLVCDNGSTDGTVDVATGFADRLPLRMVDATGQRGAGPARNAGAAVARGRWLAFADADDVVARDWLPQVCAAMRSHEFVAGRFDVTRLNSLRVRRSRVLEQDDGLQRGAQGLAHAGASNMAVHREVFDAVGGFDPTVRILEDTDLCWRIQRNGVPLVFYPAMLMHVRLRSTWRGMYRQGVEYGRAYGELQRRERAMVVTVDRDLHGAGEPQAGEGSADRHVTPSPALASGPRQVAVRVGRTARAWLGAPPNVGHLIWQLGWRRGFGTISPD